MPETYVCSGARTVLGSYRTFWAFRMGGVRGVVYERRKDTDIERIRIRTRTFLCVVTFDDGK